MGCACQAGLGMAGVTEKSHQGFLCPGLPLPAGRPTSPGSEVWSLLPALCALN